MEKTESTRRIVLKEDNYVTWLTAMEAELRHIGCWKYLEGTDEHQTEEKKEKSYCLIMRHLDESIVAFVGNKILPEERGNGRSLWNILKEKYVGSGVQAQGVALDQFMELKFKDMDQWIQDLRTTTRRMTLTGTNYPTIEEIILSVEKDRALFKTKIEPKDEVAMPAGRETRTCYSCGKIGHLSKNCRNKNQNNKKRSFQEKIAEVDEDEQEESFAFLAINNNREVEALLANNMNKQTILDSGASDHMFTNKNDFDTLENSTGAAQIGQEGVKIPIEGKGSVTKNSNERKITFQNALYVPKLPYNLISLSQIWNKGGDLRRLPKNKFTIEKRNQILFGGDIENGLLHIKFNQTQAIISKHERLGHPGKEKGCEPCHLGKGTRKQFKKELERTKNNLDELSIDLMGPIKPESLGGSKYILVLVDTASCFSWVQMLKDKSKAKEEVTKLIQQIENRFEKHIKRIICNGGKEFVNNFLKEYCGNKGIELVVTTPYTPQHNGIVERTNRSLMDKARTLRIDSGVGKELWAELVHTENYLKVRTSKDGISPYKKLFKIKPNLRRIKRFGCRAYVTESTYKKKLDNRAQKGVLVGYEQDFGVYRILLDKEKKIIRSRDVWFVKDEMPYKESNQKDTTNGETDEEDEEPIDPVKEIPQQNEERTTEVTETSQTDDRREPLVIRLRVPPVQNKLVEEQQPDQDDQVVSTENILNARTRTQAQSLLAKLIQHTKNEEKAHATFVELVQQKEEAISKTDIINAMVLEDNTNEEQNPSTIAGAKKSHNWYKWKEAYFSELDSIAEQGVFDVYEKFDIPKGKTLINTQWVFTRKFDEKGDLKGYKARCVAR
ncbi:hypothetical protein O181_061757, partial [Austropuccinia psidii MF-1]|nr:hypothetical protein [Austropuccinia psidii MF-1]